jgi:uncharacterized damage-inducible protein DinB
MTPFFLALQGRFAEMHADIENALDSLPPEALDWQPGPEMNSPGVLIVHLSGAERYWIGAVALGEALERDRAAEFQTSGLDAVALREHLRAADACLAAACKKLSLADLEKTVTSPRDGRSFTIGWALLHALEHTCLHAGHIQLLVQLWHQR